MRTSQLSVLKSGIRRDQLNRRGDDADRFVSTTPSHRHNTGWGCTALRGRKPTPSIGPSYSRCNPQKRRLPRGWCVRKTEKPGHMSGPGLALPPKPYPPSESSKPECACGKFLGNRHNASALRQTEGIDPNQFTFPRANAQVVVRNGLTGGPSGYARAVPRFWAMARQSFSRPQQCPASSSFTKQSMHVSLSKQR